MCHRYAMDGQLTVMRMSTGGTATSHIQGKSTTHDYLTLSSQLYIAGPPPDAGVGVNTCS